MEWGVILEKVLMVVIEVLLPFLLVMVIRWVMKQYEYLHAKLTVEQQQFIDSMAMSLVLAAEQVGLKDELLAEGEAKKEWVITRLEAAAQEKGINIDVHSLSDAIEAAVHKAFKMYKEQG